MTVGGKGEPMSSERVAHPEARDHAVRVAAIWCPDWPIVAFRRHPSEAVAVVHANRVVAASVSARRQGVARNLRRREAQRRCPSLAVLDRDLQQEARAFEAIAGCLDDLTPRVEIVRPGMVVFPTRGPSRYFGGDEPMAERCIALVTGVLGELGQVRVGVADGAFAASLSARRAADGAASVIAPGGSAEFLAPLPVHALERPDLTGVLARLGMDTLGGFASLSRADVVGRFGEEGGIAHRLASGLDERPPAVSDPPPDMEVVSELDPPVERIDQAAFIGKVLADQFLQRLEGRGATCTRIVIAAETEHGEELVRCWRHEGALTAAAVADRVRWQLDGWLSGSSIRRPTGGLSRLSVRPDDLVPMAGRQLGFWGGETEVAERVMRVVARVQGQLGTEAVRVPERRGGRSPHEQVVTVPADTVDLTRTDIDAATMAAPWPGALPGPPPSRVHRPRIDVEVVDALERPVGVDGRVVLTAEPTRVRVARGHSGWLRIVSWAGPWPLDERWWDEPERRRRCARLQVVLDDQSARLLVLEDGRWGIEATYD